MQTWSDAFRAWAADKERVWLAYKIGVSTTSIHFYFHGSRPYRKRRETIEQISGGRVKANLPGVSHRRIVKPNKSSRKSLARSGEARS